MRKLPWTALAIVGASMSALQIFAGCGSESGDLPPAVEVDASDDGAADGGPTGDGSVVDPFADVSVTETDGSLNDGAVCKPLASSCSKSGECCTANCAGGKCTAPVDPTCKLPGATCGSPTECCGGSCVNGVCADKQCVPDKPTAGACAQGGDCCSGVCQGGLCRSVNPGQTCRTAGNPCGGAGDCCSNFCNNGVCSDAVSFCTQRGEICAANTDCCTGNCVKVGSNKTGTCGEAGGSGAGNCAPSGTVCTSAGGDFACDQNCCSRSCGEFGALNDFKVCQPPSGCNPTGEVCRADSDCCGWAGAPDPHGNTNPNVCRKDSPTAEYGRCDNGGSCREPGSICKTPVDACSAENNCCSHSSLPSSYCNTKETSGNCCAQDALGIPRCLIKPVDCTKPVSANTVCATSADCCGNPCVNNKCGAACVQQGKSCTTTADCCTGLPCVALPGSTQGICGGSILPDGGGVSDAGNPGGGECALYGQSCTESSDCCNGVPCTPPGAGGRCRYP